MIDELQKKVIEKNGILPYINLNKQNEYKGWVSDFHVILPNANKMELILTEEKDLFLLFVLAVVWSRTGPWENAAFFVSYLKYKGYDEVEEWGDLEFAYERLKEKEEAAVEMQQLCRGIDNRKKISFRKDLYSSIHILSKNWSEIKSRLDQAELQDDYMGFITYMRNVQGLGGKSKSMNIKILLILRELRCQKIKRNIPGEYCCVPDKRVIDACKELGIELPATVSKVPQLLKASSILYSNFGNLYDIPAFAYEDLKDELISDKKRR